MTRFSRSSHVIWDIVDEQALLCDTDSAEFFDLSATGALVWRACNDLSLKELVDCLHAVYCHVPRERLHEDVSKFVSSLSMAGLLVVRDDATDNSE